MLKLKGTGGEYIKKLLRILFSRYFLSAIFILCELALLFALIAYAGSYSLIFFVFLIVLDVFTVLSLINRDANPEYKVSWLVVVLILPVFGMVLYLLFYSRKISKSDAALIESIYERLDTDDTTAAHSTYGVEMDENFAALKESDAEAAGKVLALLSDDTLARLYRHTRVEYFALGEDMYKKMLCDIENAEHCIFLEYFIIKSGKMWDEIHSLLKAKAAGGVDVRLMYDDIGCMNSLPADFEKTLAAEGIKVLCFSPVSPRISTTHNNRDHRKILIVDGKCAYTGGINIADEYINEKERFGHWKDGGVRVTGMAVKGFVRLFLSGWGHALGKNEEAFT